MWELGLTLYAHKKDTFAVTNVSLYAHMVVALRPHLNNVDSISY